MIEKVLGSIEPLQREIVNHELYTHIERPQDLHRFMEHHVYAVWDFMSLLKALQIQLTGTTLPWTPKGDPEIRYLINEIVLAEETDLDLDGQRKSHFEMYLDAMTDAGASTEKIMMLISKVSQGLPWHKAVVESHSPDSVRSFLSFTFSVIESNEPHKIAAAFTFGREDLIPQMFTSIIQSIQRQFPEENLGRFHHYFQRHIELDDDTHGPLALKMIQELCGDNPEKWEDVIQVATESLEQRVRLWDGVLEEIRLENTPVII